MNMISEMVIFPEGVLVPSLDRICVQAFGEVGCRDRLTQALMRWADNTYTEQQVIEEARTVVSQPDTTVVTDLCRGIHADYDALRYFEKLSSRCSIHLFPDIPAPLFDSLINQAQSFFENTVTSIIDPTIPVIPGRKGSTSFVAWNPKMLYGWSATGWDTLVFPDLQRFDRELKLRGFEVDLESVSSERNTI